MDIERIKKNVVILENGCWSWLRSTCTAGYGQLTENGVHWLAHRYAYACTRRLPSSKYVIRHTCHNTRCCNPRHLRAGTHKDNYKDSAELHRKVAKARRNTWIIAGVRYPTIRIASALTHISQSTIVKYTYNGVFNISSYRHSCLKAGVTPSV